MSDFEVEGGHGPEFQFTSLNQDDRQGIVMLSADANQAGYAPVTVNGLALSALGATADLDGQWDYPGGGLASWRHIAATGRDIYVRVTQKGYLFPLGHRAIVVMVVERVLVPDPVKPDWYDAYLQVERYIRVLQPEKNYPATGQPFGNNDWPFSSVEILTTVSPLLDAPRSSPGPDCPPLGGASGGSSSSYFQAFLPTSGGSAVPWDLVATDLAGHKVHLKIPLYFFAGQAGGYPVSQYDGGGLAKFVDAYNAVPAGYRQAQGNGAQLKLAPEAGGPANGTTHPLVVLTLGAASTIEDPNVPTKGLHYPSPPSSTALGDQDQPAFYPVVAQAQVHLQAADALSRGSFSDSSGDGVVLEYYAAYVANGLGDTAPPPSNPGAVYARFADAVAGNAPLLQFPADAVGGLGCPNGHMIGLSAIAGPVSGDSTSGASAQDDLDNYASSGAAVPANYFKQLTGQAQTALSQFLGGLPLGGIVKEFVNAKGGAPNITANLDQSTGVLTVSYTLTATLASWPGSAGPQASLGTVFEPASDDGQFQLTATATVAPDGTATYDVAGSVDPFTLNLFGNVTPAWVVTVPFNAVSFTATNGQKPQVQVSIGTVSFEGVLSFVNALQDFLSELGGDGLSISVTASQLDASFSLSLPSIGMGVFSLTGIALSTGLTIPFLGGPALAQFGFASQENPFQLTVCMFGGGGFFSIGLGFGGIQQIQAQFQFEGSFELDIVVASGGLTLAAGVYYSYAAPTSSGVAGTTTLTGFVRLTGELSVLGLISISAELDLSLTWTSPNSVEGTASLTVTIHLVFFSVSPSITVHKQFSGGGDPPGESAASMRPAVGAAGPDGPVRLPLPPVKPVLFHDLVNQGTWDQYVAAFGA
ncbi:MAG TPA: hypothetical protein VL984_08350 [Acidimicrobiales bacterium]|nr:hypothetical protein [Acidimicrobiales bacterium]